MEKVWDLPERLDQGQEGACVGFGWTHELLSDPDRVTGVDPFSIYHRAQQIDETPGEEYSGTSVLAGAKAVQELGHLVEYRWATDVTDVLATISVYGPVVIGVNWYAAMEDTDVSGFIHLDGAIQGGHCVCLRGVVPDPSDSFGWALLGSNSWSAAWGVNGDFKLKATDLATLLAQQGDACVPVTRTASVTVITTTTEDTTMGGDAQPGQGPAQSQQTPEQASGLQTPQADQPVPTPDPNNPHDGNDGSQDPAPTTADEGEGLQPQPPAEEQARLRDQAAAEEQRQSERGAQVSEHNARTGGGEVREGEVQAQRDEHNARVSGEVTSSPDVPQDNA